MRSPFDMISGMVKGCHVALRPVQFDDHEYNKEYKRANGQYIRPTMATTTCPMCSQLIEQYISPDIDLDGFIIVNCKTCEPKIPIQSYPFRDPIATGALTLFQINATALSNLSDMFTNKPLQATKVEKSDSDLVERRSGGLGQFIRKRDQWKKIVKAADSISESSMIESSRDAFDLMGAMMDHAIKIPVSDQLPADSPPVDTH